MHPLFKSYFQKCILLLAIIFQTQGAFSEVNTSNSLLHNSLNHIEAEQNLDGLLLLMQKRLVIMHEVARTKWNQNLPIEDKMREQQILVDLASKANQYDLDETLITSFFQAQIEASKEIQKRDFLIWKESGIVKFEKVFSLKDELRFYIDRLNHEMLLTLSKIHSNPYKLNRTDIFEYPISKRNTDYIEEDIWAISISPLKSL